MEIERFIVLSLNGWMDTPNGEEKNLTNLTNSKENDWTPSFSPIENKIVFSTYFLKKTITIFLL